MKKLGVPFHSQKKIKFQIAYKTSNTLKPLAQQITIKWNDFHNVLLRLNCILNKWFHQFQDTVIEEKKIFSDL